jgi:hypothetical protein
MRAGIVMSAYDAARQSDEKHSAAVRQAVEFVKQRHPEMRISETGVKRILAEFRPRASQTTILRFDRVTMTDAERVRYRLIRERAAAHQEHDSKVPAPTTSHSPTPVTKYMIRFAARPNYSRHNRKDPE